ncbi:MAG: DUF488 domain-containing protein [Candidatus Eremiobacteraeota bacterium]|nr:DUF488 domain-containing protein [Candidatus Eremiobacteraeota bacterium]
MARLAVLANKVTDTPSDRISVAAEASRFAVETIPLSGIRLEHLANSEYEGVPSLAPAAEMLKSYRNKLLAWDEYAASYRELLRERKPEQTITAARLDHACLLCSELAPERCHRRLAAEYLRETMAEQADIEIIHL